MNFGNLTNKKWFGYTIATCSAVLLYAILSHLGDMFAALGTFFSFLRPIISGIIIAYVINPLANFFDRKVFRNLKGEKTRWSLSCICALIVIVLFVVLLFVALIPQLVDSVSTLVYNMDTYVSSLQNFLRECLIITITVVILSKFCCRISQLLLSL